MSDPTPLADLPDAARLPPPARPGLWALPLLLSAVFVAAVFFWTQRVEREDREEARRTLITDALSAEAQVRSRLEVESAHVRNLAAQMPKLDRQVGALAAHPEVASGLRRLWISVTWLDARNRIVAHVPETSDAGAVRREGLDSFPGLTSHLVAEVGATVEREGGDLATRDLSGGRERVIVRYDPSVLLQRAVPWWLKRKYEVELVDVNDQIIASADDQPVRTAAGEREAYRVELGAAMPGIYLELSDRAQPRPWWHTLPLVLMVGFLGLIGVATVLLRRQVRQAARAEAAWRNEAAWRRAMEDSALVALRARDAQGRILFVNRTFCRMVGLEPQDLIGRRPPMPFWPAESAEEAMQRDQRNLAGQAPREGYETRWRHRAGHTLEVMVFESPLVDAEGRQIGWMGSIIDITARKRLEERERHQFEALTHQARLTTLGEVASALAHQLNQPLAAIAGYNAGILRSLQRSGFADPVVLKAVQRLGEQASEAGRIVQRIREFLTRRAPQREACDLGATLHRATELLQRELRRRGARIDWALPADLPAVQADPVLIEQLVINLVRNALDEIPPEQVPHLAITAAPVAEGFVRVDVDDNGPGLRGRRFEDLSAPFYSTKPEGMGMGLAICRSIVEVHVGDMDASASPLGGARFSFTLPRHEAAAPPTPSSCETASP